uniref:thiol oxidase n=1 Tax=viral metagenome TaxID=1070528 RepID=A0A6C0H697_9ZZZZ
MTTDKWGPVTWILIHVLAQRVHPSSLHELFNLIKSLVSNLPCPLCSDDSKKFLSKINTLGIKEPMHLQDIYFLFHNIVNKKKNKPIFEKNKLNNYNNIYIIPVYKHFIKVYNSNGNIKLLQDNFQRDIVKKNLNTYIRKYISLFIIPKINSSELKDKPSENENSENQDSK